jgi:hypothetical protein
MFDNWRYRFGQALRMGVVFAFIETLVLRAKGNPPGVTVAVTVAVLLITITIYFIWCPSKPSDA